MKWTPEQTKKELELVRLEHESWSDQHWADMMWELGQRSGWSDEDLEELELSS